MMLVVQLALFVAFIEETALWLQISYFILYAKVGMHSFTARSNTKSIKQQTLRSQQ